MKKPLSLTSFDEVFFVILAEEVGIILFSGLFCVQSIKDSVAVFYQMSNNRERKK